DLSSGPEQKLRWAVMPDASNALAKPSRSCATPWWSAVPAPTFNNVTTRSLAGAERSGATEVSAPRCFLDIEAAELACDRPRPSVADGDTVDLHDGKDERRGGGEEGLPRLLRFGNRERTLLDRKLFGLR